MHAFLSLCIQDLLVVKSMHSESICAEVYMFLKHTFQGPTYILIDINGVESPEQECESTCSEVYACLINTFHAFVDDPNRYRQWSGVSSVYNGSPFSSYLILQVILFHWFRRRPGSDAIPLTLQACLYNFPYRAQTKLVHFSRHYQHQVASSVYYK